MLCTKRYQILCRKRIYMLAGLRMLSLACKFVIYRPEHNAKGIEFCGSWNVKSEIYQQTAHRVDEKSGVICLVIMFTLRVMVIEMSKMIHFCIFCW